MQADIICQDMDSNFQSVTMQCSRKICCVCGSGMKLLVLATLKKERHFMRTSEMKVYFGKLV